MRYRLAVIGIAFAASAAFAPHAHAFEVHMPAWAADSEVAFEKLEICLYDAMKASRPKMSFQDFERLSVDICRPEREAVKEALAAAGVDAKQAAVALATRYGFARPLLADTYREVAARKLEGLAGYIRGHGAQQEHPVIEEGVEGSDE